MLLSILNMLKEIKNEIKSIFIFSITVCLLLFCGCAESNKILSIYEPDFTEKLFNGYEFNITSELPLEGRIVRKNDNADTKSIAIYLTPKGYVFKYAHDSKRYIAVHFMKFEATSNDRLFLYERKFYDWTYFVTIDEFMLLSIPGDKKTFSSQKEMLDYCDNNEILLGNWYYPSPGESAIGREIKVTGEYYIEDRGSFRGQSLVKNGVEQFQGFIDEYSTSQQYIAFHLTVAQTDYDEEIIGSTNVGLSMSQKEIKPKYRAKWFVSYPVYYRKYVLLNTATQQIKEFENKKELLKYSLDNDIDFYDWFLL